MAAGAFNACHAITAKWEGGWSDHPADPGGKTMYGVTQATFDAWRDLIGKRRASVRTLTRREAEEIYYRNYWRPVGGETLDHGVDGATYDYGVNSGPARALKALKKVLRNDPVETVKALCAQRRGFVRALSTFSVFGRGWLARIADIEARGVKMALRATPAKKADRLEDEAAAAAAAKDKAATGVKAGSGAAGGAGGAGVGIDQMGGDQTAALVLIGFAAVCVGLVLFLSWRRKVEAGRAAAFANVAAETRGERP